MKFCAVVVAAGRGVRFGQPKQLIEVAGRPLVAWSLATFGVLEELGALVIATETEHLETMATLAREHAPRLPCTVVAGGATRQGSVKNALAAVPDTCEGVFIHDGARPLVTALDVRAGMAAVRPGVGAVLAAPVVDTIKIVAPGDTRIEKTLDRATLWAAQTPQFATLADLRIAHEAAERSGLEATDDVALLEAFGLEVHVIPATGENFKVTLRGDRDLAETILRERLASARVAVTGSRRA
jgi:2-C-methyl-D-erythritol 4-phosphate cytidylyltransferase